MKSYSLLVCFLILSLSSFGQGWKKVEMNMYSFEVPADWTPENENRPRITESKSKNVREYSFFWKDPASKNHKTWDRSMSLQIDSYESLDGSPVSFQFVQDRAIATPSEILKAEEEVLEKGKKRIVVLQKDVEISIGKIKRYNGLRYILLYQTEGLIHVLTVRLRESFLKERPDKLKDIERILNSFTIK